MRRVGRIAIAVAVAAIVLAGCASEPPDGPGTDTSSADPPARVHPQRSAPDPVRAEARTRLAAMTLAERVQSLLVLHAGGTDPAAIRAVVDRYHPGGLILMGDNTAAGSPGVAAITAAASVDPALPVLVAVDQEGGEVSRIDADPSPGADVLRSASAADTQRAFAARAALLASIGISVNFGIVADVTDDPDSFLSGRVLGTDPVSSAEHVAAAVAGERGVVLSTLKHFPGHGAAPGDSHSVVPHTDESLDAWRARDAVPFEAGIRAGAGAVMFGHLVYSAVDSLPASLSPTWHSILRDELGFGGLAVTDDLNMLQDAGYGEAAGIAVAAAAAGNDLLLYVPTVGTDFDPQTVVDAIVAAVTAGTIPQSTIDRAALRVLEQRVRLGMQATGQDTP